MDIAMEIKLQDLKISSGVKFVTSGARRIVDNIMDFAGDSRQCTDRIMEAAHWAANLKYLDFYNPDKIEDVIYKLPFKEVR